MIKLVAYLFYDLVQKPDIDDHPSLWIWISSHKYLRVIRVSVDSETPFLINLTMQGMCSIEVETLTEFKDHGMSFMT